MKILKTVSIVAGLTFAAANISAQTGVLPDPGQRAQKLTDQVKQNVTGITPDQEKQIQAAELNYIKAADDVHVGANDGPNALQTQMKPISDTRDAKIKAILTAKQYSQYQKSQRANQSAGTAQNNK